MTWLTTIFSVVCGQVHCWAPGGVMMPVCERCLGLYLGALWSLLLVSTVRPFPSRALLWLHGLAMLAMIPFGYHLVPQGPVIRTVTGFVFGLGMVYYLSLAPGEIVGLERFAKRRAATVYALAALTPLPVVLVSVQYGPAVAGSVLTVLATVGLAVTVLLALASVASLLGSLVATGKAHA
jgi:uncharacterized membrane protein